MLDMIRNPAKCAKKNIDKVQFIYHSSLRHGLIVEEDGSLFLKEVFPNDTKFVKLRIVPKSLRNMIYVTFHFNPIGGHLNAYRTYFCIRLHYFWPGIFQFCKKLTHSCPGCVTSDITSNRSSKLVYSFPIDEPMNVLHVDIYAAGANFNYEGNKHYLIASWGMTSFSVMEPTSKQNASTFAAALMKIWLRFGFSHTIVVDKDSKFRATFAETAALLYINMHVLSGGNNDGMLVERVNRFLNSALQIFCNERGTVLVAQ